MAQSDMKEAFSKVMLGYAPGEVDAYIDEILDDFRKVSAENEQNKKRLILALKKLQEMDKNSGAAQSSAETTPKSVPSAESVEESRRILAEAEEKAQQIIEDAQKNAREIVRTAQTAAREKAVTITAEARKTAAEGESCAKAQFEAAEKLYREVAAFRESLFGLYKTHIEVLDKIGTDADTFFDTVADVGDSLAGTAFVTHAAEDLTETAEDFIEDEADLTETADDFIENEADLAESAEDFIEGEADFAETADDFIENEADLTETAEDFIEDNAVLTETAEDFIEDEADLAETAEDFIEGEADLAETADDFAEGEADFAESADDFIEDEAVLTETAEDFAESAEDFMDSLNERDDSYDDFADLTEDGSSFRYGNSGDPVLDELEALDALFSDDISDDDFPTTEVKDSFEPSAAEVESDPADDGYEDNDYDDDADDDDDYRIDWSLSRAEKLSDDFFDLGLKEEEQPEEDEDDFHSFDDLLEGESMGGEDALADEFDIVYSGRNSARNVEEIGRQPLIAPEQPAKPKKKRLF